MKEGDYTPWGPADFVTELAPGIVSVMTPSHGGIFLDEAHQALIPNEIMPFTEDTRFWEEDFDCYVPLLLFRPELHETGALRQFKFDVAEEILKRERPRWWIAIVKAIIKNKLAETNKALRKLKENNSCVE